MSKRAGESFSTSASAEQKPVHCSGLIAIKISDENADMDYHAVLPPEYQAGSDYKRENLCKQDSKRVTMTTTGASSSEQLGAAGVSSSGRSVAAEDPSNTGERKVHLQSNTDGEKYIKKIDDLATSSKPQSEDEQENFQSSIEQYLCKNW